MSLETVVAVHVRLTVHGIQITQKRFRILNHWGGDKYQIQLIDKQRQEITPTIRLADFRVYRTRKFPQIEFACFYNEDHSGAESYATARAAEAVAEDFAAVASVTNMQLEPLRQYLSVVSPEYVITASEDPAIVERVTMPWMKLIPAAVTGQRVGPKRKRRKYKEGKGKRKW